jgi:hypothetical protein
MDNELPRRARVPLIGMVSVHAALAILIGVASLTCTGWAVDSNPKALLGLRLGGYLFCSVGSVYAVLRQRYLTSALLLVGAGLFYIWLETGWLFIQPAFGPPSKLAMLPLLIALVVLLAPHSPTLRRHDSEIPATETA